MDELVYVYVDLAGAAHLCGRLWARARKGQENATFEYDESLLKSRARFSLAPALALGPGAFQTGQGKALFGAIGDSAPWVSRVAPGAVRLEARRKVYHERREIAALGVPQMRQAALCVRRRRARTPKPLGFRAPD